MEAEARGSQDEAKQAFTEAWQSRRDDWEGCIAAHYLARHQDSDQETLWWNAEALRLADACGDQRVDGFYPSLLLNLGHSHETLGALDLARELFERAAALCGTLPAGPYRDVVHNGLERALARVGTSVPDRPSPTDR